jgi:hypothetical protein
MSAAQQIFQRATGKTHLHWSFIHERSMATGVGAMGADGRGRGLALALVGENSSLLQRQHEREIEQAFQRKREHVMAVRT